MTEVTVLGLRLIEGVLSHFFTGSQRFELMQDGEWIYYGDMTLNTKGQDLVGALADIMLYIAVSTDQMLQVLISTN